MPVHLQEVRERRLGEIEKVEREVRARLTREITTGDSRAARLREEERAGKEQRLNAQNAAATASMLADRWSGGNRTLPRAPDFSPAAPRSRRCLVGAYRLLRKVQVATPIPLRDG